MATLIGSTNQGSDIGISNNFNVLGQFTAIASGTAKTFNVYLAGTGGVQIAVYDDNAGSPNNLLASVLSFSGAAGWNVITIPDLAIVSGTKYWLGTDTQSSHTQALSTGGSVDFKSLTYGTAFPNPAGSGYSTGTAWTLATYLDGTLTPSTAPKMQAMKGWTFPI